jgi:hypothetical protein
MAQRFHPIVEHANDDNAVAPIIEAPAQIVDNMRSGTTAARSEFDMKGPEAVGEVISLTRPRTFRALGDHPDRPVDKRAVPPALQSSKLPPRLSQDVNNVLCCGLGELMIQGCLGGCLILRVQLGGDFGHRSF